MACQEHRLGDIRLHLVGFVGTRIEDAYSDARVYELEGMAQISVLPGLFPVSGVGYDAGMRSVGMGQKQHGLEGTHPGVFEHQVELCASPKGLLADLTHCQWSLVESI